MDPYDSELSKIVAELNRAAPSSKAPATARGVSPQSTATLDKLLHQATARNASDILLVAGAPVMLRVTGNLVTTPGRPHGRGGHSRTGAAVARNPIRAEELHRNKTVDFGFYP